jgi:hypothetical protein
MFVKLDGIGGIWLEKITQGNANFNFISSKGFNSDQSKMKSKIPLNKIKMY